MKKYIREYALTHNEKLTKHVGLLEKQTGQVRAEVERWQMRNEEVETRLQTFMERCWKLKQIILS